MAMEIGTTIKGTVLKVADYGAIVRLPGGNTGLVHISEIADAYVRDVRDYVREEDEVVVKIIRLNNKGRYELSIKQCEPDTAPVNTKPLAAVATDPPRKQEQKHSRFFDGPPPQQKSPATFEDRLSKYLKDSEERMHDLKRHMESKRGRK